MFQQSIIYRMKIRTITLGFSDIPTPRIVARAGQQLEWAYDHFVSNGYTVQTRRIALSHWNQGLGLLNEEQRTGILHELDLLCAENRIDYCSLGVVGNSEQIESLSNILTETTRLNAAAEISSLERGVNRKAIRASVKVVRNLSEFAEGFGNFRFGAGACLNAGTPFFPGSYHNDEQPAFTIGFENGDLLVKAFSDSGEIETAKQNLLRILTGEYQKVESLAMEFSEASGLHFGGLDTSIAPSIKPDESITRAFESVNVRFGDWGTLAVCGNITDVLKRVPVKRTGYCGIMLPVLEDTGLAKAVDDGNLTITDLLAYSGVCGVGIDMVPISGDTAAEKLEGLMLDVGTMAWKLKKPLSVRVLPINSFDKRTRFDSELTCNSKLLSL